MEIKITKPNKYADSWLFQQETGFSYYQKDNDFYLVGDASEQELLKAFTEHNPPAPKQRTIEEKLASVGLSLEELKAALGGN